MRILGFPAKYRHTVLIICEFLFCVFGIAPSSIQWRAGGRAEQSQAKRIHISKQTNSGKIIHQEEQAHTTSYASKIIMTLLPHPFLMIQVE
jgi:hypothetical protein